jgi:serine protease Do
MVCSVTGSAAGDQHQELTDEDGDPVRIEYVGSGFLATDKGHVITNRHVAEPWWKSPQSQFGFEGHFVHLEVVFPGRQPVVVDPRTIRLRKDEIDVAVFTVDAGDAPVLPLFAGDPDSLRGERVVVLGYPTGVNALLAKAEPEVLREVLAAATDLTSVIAELARRDGITPVATQGALNEVFDKQMVYDAGTTQGGSGGPVFGSAGTVIGVNFAVLQEFGSSNFGVPIRHAAELLR